MSGNIRLGQVRLYFVRLFQVWSG